MHLKYLSLCLFSLGLTACAQHGVRPQVASASLEQKPFKVLMRCMNTQVMIIAETLKLPLILHK